MSSLAPILLFVYNRPEHTKRTLDALCQNNLARDSKLIIYADGPKDGASKEEINLIKETRSFCKDIIGFASVKVIESNYNKGLDPSEIDGITNVINEYDKVIVLEDDLITNKYFLRYMNEALDFYHDDNRIFQIAGFTDNIQFPMCYTKYHNIFASHRVESCGWATWKDRWNLCKWNEENYDIIKYPNKLKINKFNRGGADLYDQLLNKLSGITDAWDIRWQNCVYEHEALCIRPVRSMIYNIGFDGTGVHSGVIEQERVLSATAPLYNESKYDIQLEHNIKPNYFVQKRIQKFFRPARTPLWKRCKRKIRYLFESGKSYISHCTYLQ